MKIIFLLIAGFVVCACSSQSSKDKAILVAANQIHLESEAIQEQIEPEIEKIDSLRNLLLARKTAKADSLAMNLMRLKADFENWEKNFFAVPGFEHKNEEVHGHHHDHTPAPELPADKMLEVQEEIKSNIERIKTDLYEALSQVKALL